MPHEEWCDILFTMDFKDSRVKAKSQTNNPAASKTAPSNYYGDASVKVTRKKNARTSALTYRKKQGNKTTKNSGAQNYCVLYNK